MTCWRKWIILQFYLFWLQILVATGNPQKKIKNKIKIFFFFLLSPSSLNIIFFLLDGRLIISMWCYAIVWVWRIDQRKKNKKDFEKEDSPACNVIHENPNKIPVSMYTTSHVFTTRKWEKKFSFFTFHWTSHPLRKKNFFIFLHQRQHFLFFSFLFFLQQQPNCNVSRYFICYSTN